MSKRLVGAFVGVGLGIILTFIYRSYGLPLVFLVLGAGALVLSITFIWASLTEPEKKNEMDFEQALAFAMPTVAEEQKVAILRALKDLEYERHVGKISDEDYRAASAEYRERAKTSIARADASLLEGRKIVEKWVSEFESQPKPSSSPAPENNLETSPNE